MADATKDFEDLFACFAKQDVRAVVVGAHAVAFHAKPRYTKDLDILIEPTPGNAKRVVAALAEFGFGDVGLTADDFASPGRVVQLGHPPNRIDLITSIDGVSFSDVWNGRVEGRYGNAIVQFIGRDELIRNKRASARPQDLADLSWLEPGK